MRVYLTIALLLALAPTAGAEPCAAVHGDACTTSGTAATGFVAVQPTSEKGVANGYAGLDGAGLVPVAQLPGLPAAWGAITGTLSAQTDLQTALDGKSATSHTHTGVYEPAGVAFSELSGTASDAQVPAAVARDSEVTSEIATHAGAADPHTGYQRESEKAAANGYASLDGNTRVPLAQLGSGTADTTTYLRGDGSWQVPAGGAGPVTAYHLAADHAISSTTATEVMQAPTLAAGTYVFEWFIVGQSATTTVGLKFGVNYTGTATTFVARLEQGTTGAAAATGVVDGTIATLTGNVLEHSSAITETTAAPNLGPTTGVSTVNENALYTIRGVMVVTNGGDLELWHGSETATSTTVKAGTSLILTKVN